MAMWQGIWSNYKLMAKGVGSWAYGYELWSPTWAYVKDCE